ncbi:MAG: L-ribulose-5-phosphate 4-epimerase AraD [Bacteroidetes bacterium]|nr:L-ribulose-5-phosphate 4-epimerase AraD [Bacteroidota bacterium]
MYKKLKKEVFEANLKLVEWGLVSLTWGNVSGIDREKGVVVIKPSGVPYAELTPNHMVVVDLNGNLIDGELKPSSDTPTHLELYRMFPAIGGIAHSHSTYATAFAQARVEIPCVGTTHADVFNGPVPVTRFLTKKEVETQYELNTGKVIIERFKNLDPQSLPGVLVAGHAPFTWGSSALEAVEHMLSLERIAEMALYTLILQPTSQQLPKYILRKHFQRKHGSGAYYGQQR